MPIEVELWRIDAAPARVELGKIDYERRLEDVLHDTPAMVNPGWMWIGRQVDTGFGGRIDLLALDGSGALIVLELKRGKTPRELVAQLLDYGYWASHLDTEALAQVYTDYRARYAPQLPAALEDRFLEFFGDGAILPNELPVGHVLVAVAVALDVSTERIINYLTEEYSVPVNAVFFNVFKDGEREYLSRAWLIDPAVAEVRQRRGVAGAWNNEYYVSFGEGVHRNWDDARKYGFISAGQGSWYSKTLKLLQPGTRIWVNLPGRGYAGVGMVTGNMTAVRDFVLEQDGVARKLSEVELAAEDMFENSDDLEKSEYIVPVQWIKTVPRELARRGSFGNQNSVCQPRVARWQETIDDLRVFFEVSD